MIKAGKQDRDHVVGILHSAFEPITDDNSINFVVKQDHKRSERIKILMEFLVDDCLDFGEVLLSDKRNACILLKYPHKAKTTFAVLWRHVKLAFKCIGLLNVPKVLKRQAIIKKHHIKGTYIHPVIMGATSEVRGFGFGVRLIKQLFDDRDEKNKLPVIIETTTDENLKMYQRFGFKLIKEVHTKNFPIYFLRLN